MTRGNRSTEPDSGGADLAIQGQLETSLAPIETEADRR